MKVPTFAQRLLHQSTNMVKNPDEEKATVKFTSDKIYNNTILDVGVCRKGSKIIVETERCVYTLTVLNEKEVSVFGKDKFFFNTKIVKFLGSRVDRTLKARCICVGGKLEFDWGNLIVRTDAVKQIKGDFRYI